MSVMDGLHTDADGGQPSEDDAFAASLGGKMAALGVTPPEPPANDAPPAATEEPSGPPRGPDGKFLPRETPEGEVEETPPGVEPTPVAPAETPDEYRIRYEEAQKVIGRQGTELGEARARLAALEQAAQTPVVEPPTYLAPEQAEMLVEHHGGLVALQAAIEDGLDPDSQAFQAIADAASENADTQAEIRKLAVLEAQYRTHREAAPAAGETPAAPAADPVKEWVNAEYQARMIEGMVSQIKAVTPDFEALGPHFPKALELSPHLRAELETGDPAKLHAALGGLVLVARGIAATDGVTPPATATEAAAAALVATGGTPRPPVGAVAAAVPNADTDWDAFATRFKEEFSKATSTSVADGLSLE